MAGWRGKSGLALLMSSVAFLAGYWLGGSRVPALVQEVRSSPEAEHSFLTVKTERISMRDVSHFLEAAGEVQSKSELEIDSRIAARIVAVHVKAQDRVSTGDLLVTLDDAELQEQRRQAESGLARGEAVLEEARSQLRRMEGLFERRVETQQAVERSRRDHRSAASEVDRLRQALAEASVRLEFARVRSPISGIVVDRRAEPGELAMPGKVLMEIHDPAALRFQAMVPESCYPKAQPGVPIQIRMTGVPGPIETSITELVPRVDPASRMFPVRADLPADLPVRPGTFGTMALPCRPVRLLAVPRKALVQRGQLDLVFVVRDGRADLRLVTLGRSMPDVVEVLTGMVDGEWVVIDPPPALRDGDSVDGGGRS